MPMKHVTADRFTSYRGVEVFYTYGNNEYDNRMTYRYSWTDEDNKYGAHFDVQELPTWDSEKGHLEAIKAYIDHGLDAGGETPWVGYNEDLKP